GNNKIAEYTTSGATVNAALVSGLVGPTGIAVTAAASPTNRLAFIESPASTTAAGTLGPITVDVEDSNGTFVAGDNSNVTLAIASGSSGATLDGTTTVAAVNGVATFSDLLITTPGDNYTLVATDGTFSPATSAPFSITATTPPASVALTLGNVALPTSAVAGRRIMAKVPVILTNGGSRSRGTYTISLFADTANMLDGMQSLISTVSKSISLNAGKRVTISISVRSLPATLANGVYYILAQVVGPTGDASVIASSQTVTVAAPFIKLTASAGQVIPRNIDFGKSGLIALTVVNSGDVDANGSLALALYPSTDGVSPLEADMLLKVTKNVKIKAGKTKTFKLHFKLGGLLGGTYFPYISVSLGNLSTTAAGSASFTVE
ncbi:MAG TPA: hypothetical protein VFC46_07330, partial [Humisphaera sp.]|nr:hypothetical protein [Humisphaera sp.]